MLKHHIYRNSLAFIRPDLEYVDIIWDNCTQQDSELLESVPLEAARIISRLRKGTSNADLYQELGLEILDSRKQNHKLISFYKTINLINTQYMYNTV